MQDLSVNRRGQKGKRESWSQIRGGATMKGYNTDAGYMGYVDGRYILFSSEDDYYDYLAEE